MNCREVTDQIGSYLDGELPPERVQQLRAHLDQCPDCSRDLERQATLLASLRAADPAAGESLPSDLWESIESGLTTENDCVAHKRLHFAGLWRKPLALAASIAVLVGIVGLTGLFLSSTPDEAHAGTIDYGVLLSGLNGRVDAAIDRFLNYYHAVPVTAEQAHNAAPALSFGIPPALPGGFVLQQAYRVEFGKSPGAAAVYRRNEEPLVVFFHPSSHGDHTGKYKETACIVGNHEGVQIQVGDWRLMHFMDQTTCHCVLTRLDSGPVLEQIIKDVAPRFVIAQPLHMH